MCSISFINSVQILNVCHQLTFEIVPYRVDIFMVHLPVAAG